MDLPQNDTILVNGQQVNVNKFILATNSSYFKDLFFDAGGHHERDTIPEINDIEVELETFKQMLNLIPGTVYSNNATNLNDENIESILCLANKFQLNVVKKKCDEYLADKTNTRKCTICKFRLAYLYELRMTKDSISFTECRTEISADFCSNVKQYHMLSPSAMSCFDRCYKANLLVSQAMLLSFSVAMNFARAIGRKLCQNVHQQREEQRSFEISMAVSFIITVVAGIILTIIYDLWSYLLLIIALFLIGMYSMNNVRQQEEFVVIVIFLLSLLAIPLWFLCNLLDQYLESLAEKIPFLNGQQDDGQIDSIRVNGKIFKINKHLLAAQSPYFRRLFFDENFEEYQNQNFIIDDPTINLGAFKAILDAIRPKDKPPKDGHIEAVLMLADRFDIATVKEVCEWTLEHKCRMPWLFKYRMAETYGMIQLKNRLITRFDQKELAQMSAPIDFLFNAKQYGMLEETSRQSLEERIGQI